MKELSPSKKSVVVRLFFDGFPFDEIARQAGVAKGSVVNIVDQLRDGSLQPWPEIGEYIEALRKLAIDLNKHRLTLAQAGSCVRVYNKLKALGVDRAEAERGLDICQKIVAEAGPGNRFVKSALEMDRLASQMGLSYESVVSKYRVDFEALQRLDVELDNNRTEMHRLEEESNRKKQEADQELNSIVKATAEARKSSSRQKKKLSSEMAKHLADHKLSLKEVKTAVALLRGKLGKAGWSPQEIDSLSEDIAAVGSLSTCIKELGTRRYALQMEVDKLTKESADCEVIVKMLRRLESESNQAVRHNKAEEQVLNQCIGRKKTELERVEQEIFQNRLYLFMSNLMLQFLATPSQTSDYEFDRLFDLMRVLKRRRLNADSATGEEKDLKCNSDRSPANADISLEHSEIELARQKIAYLLMPLVRDKFIPLN